MHAAFSSRRGPRIWQQEGGIRETLNIVDLGYRIQSDGVARIQAVQVSGRDEMGHWGFRRAQVIGSAAKREKKRGISHENLFSDLLI
jgi:hypothetical protein